MKLQPRVCALVGSPQKAKRGAPGVSLIEMIVSLGIGSIVLVVIGLLSLFGLRSFLVMGNCAALDDKNRLVADQITRELRQATGVLSFQADADGQSLVLTNSLEGYGVTYRWRADARTLACEKADQPEFICLRDCNSWEVLFLQNIPQASATQPFLPATNALGNVDLDQARVVSLSWKCSRPVPGSKIKTESAQTLQVVLRNTAQP